MSISNIGIICLTFLGLIIIVLLHFIYTSFKELKRIRTLNENSVIALTPITPVVSAQHAKPDESITDSYIVVEPSEILLEYSNDF